MLYKWKELYEQRIQGKVLIEDERDELKRLRKEVQELRMEKAILKKGERLLRERNEIKFAFIKAEATHYPVCFLMAYSASAKVNWLIWLTYD